MRMRHPAKNGYGVNAYERFHVCRCGHGYGIRIRIRQIESLYVAIPNASALKTHDQFSGVMLIHGVSPQMSRGRALKSFRMLLDRRRPLSCERVVHQSAVVHYYMCSVSFLP